MNADSECSDFMHPTLYIPVLYTRKRDWALLSYLWTLNRTPVALCVPYCGLLRSALERGGDVRLATSNKQQERSYSKLPLGASVSQTTAASSSLHSPPSPPTRSLAQTASTASIHTSRYVQMGTKPLPTTTHARPRNCRADLMRDCI